MTLLASQFRCEPEWQGEQCHDIPTTQMSALGQKQTFALQKAMSASPPKADMCVALAYVCFGPKADISKVQKDRLAAVSPKILQCFETLKLARSAASTLQVSRSAASALQV
jgi:hypothetical protein